MLKIPFHKVFLCLGSVLAALAVVVLINKTFFSGDWQLYQVSGVLSVGANICLVVHLIGATLESKGEGVYVTAFAAILSIVMIVVSLYANDLLTCALYGLAFIIAFGGIYLSAIIDEKFVPKRTTDDTSDSMWE